jgi:anaerobic magnesium-protoporphyrin IX monomethyl ester cyclase
MRVLFIDPPFYRFMGYYTRYFPYGIACLATQARQFGHEVSALDADHDPAATGVDYQSLAQVYPGYLHAVAHHDHPIWTELRQTLNTLNPEWVGITALTTKMAAVLQTVTVVRAVLRHVPIVIGGPHASVRPFELLHNAPEADAVVVGEGEPILERILTPDRERLVEMGQSIPGLVCRETKRVADAPAVPASALLPPARDCFLAQRYSREDLGLVMTTRGCPYRCTYCFSRGLWRRTVRPLPLAALNDELRTLKNEFGVRHITFKDDVFTLSRARTLDLCAVLREQGLTWDCVTRLDTIDAELLAIMKNHGCTGIKVGVETGSSRLMKALDRQLSVETVLKACTRLKRSGIHWTAYFMMGLPGETLEDVEATYQLMRAIAPDFASLSGYEAFPGTELFDTAREQQIVKDHMDRGEFFTTNPHDYYFVRADRGMILPAEINYTNLEAAMQARFHRYNAHPKRLYRRFRARLPVWRREPSVALKDSLRLRSWITPGQRHTP